MKNNIKILIVEDDIFTAETIESYLKRMGFTCIYLALTYKKAIKCIEEKTFDLILLDVELDKNHTGIDIAYKEKVFQKIPIIYITGCKDSHTKEELRATNPKSCLLKPITYEQLEMNISVDLFLELNEKEVVKQLNFDYSYALKSRTLFHHKETIELTPKEKILLEKLIETKGKVVAQRELELVLWGYNPPPSENSLRTLIGTLKKKLNHKMIVNERSVGYKLC